MSASISMFSCMAGPPLEMQHCEMESGCTSVQPCMQEDFSYDGSESSSLVFLSAVSAQSWQQVFFPWGNLQKAAMFCISYSFPSLPLHRIHYHRYYRCPRYALGGKEEEELGAGWEAAGSFLVGIFTKMWKQVWCRLLHDAVQDCWLEKGVVELWVGGGGGGSGIRV